MLGAWQHDENLRQLGTDLKKLTSLLEQNGTRVRGHLHFTSASTQSSTHPQCSWGLRNTSQCSWGLRDHRLSCLSVTPPRWGCRAFRRSFGGSRITFSIHSLSMLLLEIAVYPRSADGVSLPGLSPLPGADETGGPGGIAAPSGGASAARGPQPPILMRITESVQSSRFPHL
jgi:hypothetical protein